MGHVLSIILFAPLLGALVLLFIPKENANAIRWVANIFAFSTFLISLTLAPALWTQRFVSGFNSSRVHLTTGFPRLELVTAWVLMAFRFC